MTRHHISERDALIVAELHAGEMTVADLANSCGLTRSRVYQIARSGGVTLRGHVYSDAEKAHFLQKVALGLPYRHCVPSGRCRLDATKVAKRLGVWTKRHHINAWSSEDEAYLCRHYGHVRVAVVAAHLKRTRNEIIGKAHRMGLSKPKDDA